MGRQIKGLLYFYCADIRHSLTIFWTILMSVVVVTLTIAYFMKSMENSYITLSVTGPMYIYCAILGFLTVKEAIPFSLKRGATRKNIFVSLAIFFLGLAFIKAVVGSTLQVLISLFNEKIEIVNLVFIHPAFFTSDTWFQRVFIDTTIMFFFFAVMFVIGLLFYKYGLLGGGTVVGLFVIFILIGVAQDWLIDFFVEQFTNLDTQFYFQLFGIGLLFYGLSILLLKRITIIKTS